MEALGQGHTLAEKTGLGVENLHKFIEAFLTPWDAMYSNRMTSGDYHKREFPLVGIDLALKDIGHVLELARTAGTKTGSLETALGHLQAVKKYQGERGDLAGVYGAVRQEAGLSYEN